MKLAKTSDDEKSRIASEILAEYLEGGVVKESAQRRGISDTAAYNLLAKYALQGFKDAQVAVALRDLDEAEGAIRDATDHLTLGKGERLLKAAQWKLERVLRAVYGQDSSREIVAPVVIQIANLRGDGNGAPFQLRAVAIEQQEPPARLRAPISE